MGEGPRFHIPEILKPGQRELHTEENEWGRGRKTGQKRLQGFAACVWGVYLFSTNLPSS